MQIRASGNLIVETSDVKFSRDPNQTLITYALGSCIAVVVHQPRLRIGGMIHYMLPRSSISPQKAKANPAMFADTGVPLLFRKMYELGCDKRDLVVKVAGGANVFDASDTFCIGKRNYALLRKLLSKNGINITSEDVGGTKSRTVTLRIESGRVTVKSDGEEKEL